MTLQIRIADGLQKDDVRYVSFIVDEVADRDISLEAVGPVNGCVRVIEVVVVSVEQKF